MPPGEVEAEGGTHVHLARHSDRAVMQVHDAFDDREAEPGTMIAGLVLFQTVVNLGMNLGIMPVTGIPLPFVSYGGSSYATSMLGMGIIESVAMRHKKLAFD